VLYLRFITNPKGTICFSLRGMRFSFPVFRNILRYGLPAMFTLIVSPLVNMQIQSAINAHGTDAIAGNTACMQYENLISYVALSLSGAALTFMGQNIGAGKPDRVRRSFLYAMITSTAACALLILLIEIFARPLLSIYVGDSAAAVEYGVTRMRHVLFFYIFTSNPMNVAIRAFGHPQLETGVNLSFSLGFRTLWMQFIYPLRPTAEMLYLCFTISWIASALILTVFFFYALRQYRKNKLVKF
jgi:Na+-driven multidrug efflux pump